MRGACVLARGAGVLALLFVFSAAAVAMTACQPSRPSDARDYWSWRLIDARQCWYQGQPGRSKATLFWPVEQPPPAEPEVEQPEQLAKADGDRTLLESYWPDLDSLPVVFPTDRWWPRDIVIVDMARGPPATRSSGGYEGAIAALLMMLATLCALARNKAELPQSPTEEDSNMLPAIQDANARSDFLPAEWSRRFSGSLMFHVATIDARKSALPDARPWQRISSKPR
jgi:hypothetical protein